MYSSIYSLRVQRSALLLYTDCCCARLLCLSDVQDLRVSMMI